MHAIDWETLGVRGEGARELRLSTYLSSMCGKESLTLLLCVGCRESKMRKPATSTVERRKWRLEKMSKWTRRETCECDNLTSISI
jgi:hypothetical protein